MQLRILNKNGEEAFNRFIEEILYGNYTDKPDLNNQIYSSEYYKKCDVDMNAIYTFKNKYQLGEYIYKIFIESNIEYSEAFNNPGIFSWLSYIWFDHFTNNKKVTNIEDGFIFNNETRFNYKHFVYGPYLVYNNLNTDSKLILSANLYSIGDFLGRFAFSGYLFSSSGVIKLANILYYDVNLNKQKIGSTTEGKPGNLRRFIKIIGQLEANFDIYNMSEDELFELMPPEFDIRK